MSDGTEDRDDLDVDEVEDLAGLGKAWMEILSDAEKAFQTYHEKCDNIDAKFAKLDRLADVSGDREFQMFWANLEILKPIIYQRAPKPAVVPRHRDGGERARKAAELLERVLDTDVEMDDLHETLVLVRDDLTLNGRGVVWVIDDGSCIHVDRQDFRHDPARKWSEVDWVARRAYLTRDKAKERFGDIALDLTYAQRKEDTDGDDYKASKKTAEVWEIWCRSEGLVYWVSEGVEDPLDTSEPMISVKGFFPCPKPVYSTVERRTLKPVPDYVYYRDQLDEIDELTARISSLSESLRLKGFYASGGSELGEAIETAMKQMSNSALLVPVSGLAALGGAAKDAIVWLPVAEVAQTIVALVALRKQIIDDVYQITGISDIMRGDTKAHETATAQGIKAQYGSVRVRERQAEMARLAVDILRMKAEVFAENYPAQDLARLAAMTFTTNADVQKMQMQYQQAEQQFQAMQAAAQQSGQELKVPPPPKPDLSNIVTIEQVDQLLKAENIRPFVLDVETDSTIAPDEQAEKQSRIDFIGAVGGFLREAIPMVMAEPDAAPFISEMLKWTAQGFRAGRDLGSVIDDFADKIEKKAKGAAEGNKPPDGDMIRAQVEMAKVENEKAALGLKAQEFQWSQEMSKANLARDWVDTQIKQQRLVLDAAVADEEAGNKAREIDMKTAETEIDAVLRVREAAIEEDQRRPVRIGP